MVPKVQFRDLRVFYELDDESVALLREHRPFLLAHFGEALDAVYRHIRQFGDGGSADKKTRSSSRPRKDSSGIGDRF